MFFKSTASLFLALGLTGLGSAERPNVLLIMVDDMNNYTGYLDETSFKQIRTK